VTWLEMKIDETVERRFSSGNEALVDRVLIQWAKRR
jgi:hypothetical protein